MDWLWMLDEIDPHSQFIGQGVIERAIAIEVRVWILGLGEQTDRDFEIHFLAVVQAEGEELFIAILSRQMVDNLQRTPPHHRIAAQEMGSKPFASSAAIGKELLADHLVNGRIIIDKQTDQCIALALRE